MCPLSSTSGLSDPGGLPGSARWDVCHNAFLFYLFLKLLYFLIISSPLWQYSHSAGQFGLLGEWVVTEVNGLGCLLTSVTAPGLTPQPVLRKTLDGDLMDHVIGEVLVQVGQTVGVLTQSLDAVQQRVMYAKVDTNTNCTPATPTG